MWPSPYEVDIRRLPPPPNRNKDLRSLSKFEQLTEITHRTHETSLEDRVIHQAYGIFMSEIGREDTSAFMHRTQLGPKLIDNWHIVL